MSTVIVWNIRRKFTLPSAGPCGTSAPAPHSSALFVYRFGYPSTVLLSFSDSLSGFFCALLGVYLFFSSSTIFHFFLGVFLHFSTGVDTLGNGFCSVRRGGREQEDCDCLEYPPKVYAPQLLFQHIQHRHHACHCPVRHKKHEVCPQRSQRGVNEYPRGILGEGVPGRC